jgi:hypothetical protein
MITRAFCPGGQARRLGGNGWDWAVMAVAVQVDHRSSVSLPATANRLNHRFAWRPKNGHGGGG